MHYTNNPTHRLQHTTEDATQVIDDDWTLTIAHSHAPMQFGSLTEPAYITGVLQEVYKCDGSMCRNRELDFKTMQLLVEVVHHVEGVAPRAYAVIAWKKWIRPLKMSRGS